MTDLLDSLTPASTLDLPKSEASGSRSQMTQRAKGQVACAVWVCAESSRATAPTSLSVSSSGTTTAAVASMRVNQLSR